MLVGSADLALAVRGRPQTRRDGVWLVPLAAQLTRLLLDPLDLPYYWFPVLALGLLGVGLVPHRPAGEPGGWTGWPGRTRVYLTVALVTLPNLPALVPEQAPPSRFATLALAGSLLLVAVLTVRVRRDAACAAVPAVVAGPPVVTGPVAGQGARLHGRNRTACRPHRPRSGPDEPAGRRAGRRLRRDPGAGLPGRDRVPHRAARVRQRLARAGRVLRALRLPDRRAAARRAGTHRGDPLGPVLPAPGGPAVPAAAAAGGRLPALGRQPRRPPVRLRADRRAGARLRHRPVAVGERRHRWGPRPHLDPGGGGAVLPAGPGCCSARSGRGARCWSAARWPGRCRWPRWWAGRAGPRRAERLLPAAGAGLGAAARGRAGRLGAGARDRGPGRARLAGAALLAGHRRGGRDWQYPADGGLLARECLGAGLGTVALLLAGPVGPVGRLLGAGPLVWVGRRSYGAYLYHPVLLLAIAPLPVAADPLPRTALLLAATLAAAAASYRWVEQPVLARARSAGAGRARARPPTVTTGRPA